MEHLKSPEAGNIEDTLASRHEAKGYTHEELAVATGLTIKEIAAAEDGDGCRDHIARIESVLG